MPQSPVHSQPNLGIVEFVCLMAFMTSLVALSLDAMLPALSQIGADLGSSSPQQEHLIISVFFIGMAFGQLFYGPFADARGRRAAILSGLLVFVLGTVVCMLSDSMEMLLFGRLIQSFGVSGPRIAAMAVIRDQFAGESMARVMSFIMVVFILVPMIAPIIGQTVLFWFSWQHIFALFLIVALIVGVWFFWRQPETLPAANRIPFSIKTFKRSCRYILTHREVMGVTVGMGCIFGAFLAYLSASQTIFQQIYAAGDLFPLIFASLAASIGLASLLNGALVMRLGMQRLCYIALWGSIALSSVLLMVVFSFDGLPPMALFIGLLFALFFFIGVLFGNLNAMAMHPLGAMAGLGAAIIGSLSSIMSVPIALIIDTYLQHNLYPIAIGFLVFSILATIAIFWSDASQPTR